MLNKKEQIDQLFLEKLKDYQKDPPVFLWDEIEKKIHNRKGKSNFWTIIAVAAAILALFLSGWWMVGPDITHQHFSQSVIAPNEFQKLSEENQKQTGTAVSPKEFKPSAFSMATFAAKKTFSDKKSDLKSEGEEPIAFDIEKKILTKINSKENLLGKLSSLFSPLQTDQNEIKVNLKQEDLENSTDEHRSQQEKEEIKHNWSISFQAAPVFTGGIKSMEGQKNHAENTASAGLMAGYRVGKRLSIRSGLVLSQIKQKTEPISLTVQNPATITTSLGKVNINRTTNDNLQAGIRSVLRQQLDYIGIPVLANYRIIDKKFNLGITGGINANLLTGNKTELSNSLGDIDKAETENIREVALSGEVGLEMGYDIGKRITITIEPRLKHFVNSLSSNSAFNFKPYQAGLYTGVTYSFN